VDSGAEWQREESGCLYALNGVSVDPASGNTVAVGDRGTILRRGESGIWADVSPEGIDSDLYSVALGVGGVCMVCGEGGILLSSFDGGVSWREWEQSEWPDDDLLSVNFDPTHTAEFLITGKNGFLFSTAAGGPVTPGTESDAVASCTRVCGGAPDMVIFRDGTVLSVSSASEDGGIEGGTVNCATPVVSGGSFFIAAGPGGFISVFDGAWREVDSVTGYDLFSVAVLMFGGEACAVGENGTILVSSDRGFTWSEAPSGTSRNLNGVAGNGAGIGYIVGDGAFPRWFPR